MLKPRHLSFELPRYLVAASEPFKQGYKGAYDWFLEGAAGSSINPFALSTADNDAWSFGWSRAAQYLELKQSQLPKWFRRVQRLSGQWQEKLGDHIRLHADPNIPFEDHYRIFLAVINAQLNSGFEFQQPPWFWEPNAMNYQNGSCQGYDERDLVLSISRAD